MSRGYFEQLMAEGKCPSCAGNGQVDRVVPTRHVGPCRTCGGTGKWPPEYEDLTGHLEVGQRVAYLFHPAGIMDALEGKRGRRAEGGEGVISLIWYGARPPPAGWEDGVWYESRQHPAEIVDVARPDGTIVHLCPGLGDVIEVQAPSQQLYEETDL